MKFIAFLCFSCALSVPALALTDEYAQAGSDLGLAGTCVQYYGDMALYDYYEHQLRERNLYEVAQGIAGAPDPAEVNAMLAAMRPAPPAPGDLPETVPEVIAEWCDGLRSKMRQ